jgi:PAS domain S-box-containing protein
VTNLPPERRAAWLGYIVGVVLVAFAAGVKLTVGPLLGAETPFLLMILPPILATWYGGLAPGLFSTALAALATGYFFGAEPGALRMGLGEVVQLSIFAAEAALLAVWSSSRDRAQVALRAADQRAASILESISDAFLALDRDYRFTYVNRAAEELVRRPADELLGRSVGELFPLRENFRPAMDEHAPVAIEHFWETAKRWFDIRAYPAPDGGVSVYFRDITERKRAEDESRRLAAIVESSEDAILSVSLDGTILTWNRGAERIYGYPPAEAAGRPLAMLMPGEAQASALLGRLREGQDLEQVETVHVRKDRTPVPVWVTASPIRDQAGAVHAASLIARDIAERKRLEQSMRDAQKLESLGVLAGGVAHDFNNLLTGILGNASMAADMLPESSPARDAMESVVLAAQRAADLTRQMLAYAGKGRFVLERVDLTTLVVEITGLIQSSIPRKVRLEMNLVDGLPPVAADPGQMQQLVMNLVLNAGEAIGEEMGTVSVSTSTCDLDDGDALPPEFPPTPLQPGTYVCLEVKDTGSGMDEETLSKIFDPFFTTKFTGRGLGLAAVSGIVRGHKGAMSVTSAPGRGSTFRVLLPAAARVVEMAPALSNPDLRGAGTVLVVDDEEMVRRTAAAMLRKYGYNVLVAGHGPEAIRIFRERAPEIEAVLLDMTMPEMSGEEVLRRLREIRPDVRVIVSSGYHEQEALRRFDGQTIAGFIQKPYTAVRLAEKLKDAA